MPSGRQAALLHAGRLGALRSLQIWGCDVADLRALTATLPGLTQLSIGLIPKFKLRVRDTMLLSRMPNLARLTLRDAVFKTVAFFELHRLTALVGLTLGTCSADQGELQLRCVLSHLTCLTEAMFDQVPSLCDADLAALPPSLRSLNFDASLVTAAGIASLGRLTALTCLKQYLSERAGVEDDGIPGLNIALAGVVAEGLPLAEIAISAASADVSFLHNLASLTSLQLFACSPDVLAHLPPLAARLRELKVAWMGLSDAGLAIIAGLSALTSLDLEFPDDNGGFVATDVGLGALRALPALRVLDLDLSGTGGAGITDAGLDHLLACTSLRRLTLSLDPRAAITFDGTDCVRAHPATRYFNPGRWEPGDGVFQRVVAENCNDAWE
jgi:hypothetical protein